MKCGSQANASWAIAQERKGKGFSLWTTQRTPPQGAFLAHQCDQTYTLTSRSLSFPQRTLSSSGSLPCPRCALGVQVVSQHSSLLAPLAVDCVLAVSDPETPGVVDLRDIKVLKKLGGTVRGWKGTRGLRSVMRSPL